MSLVDGFVPRWKELIAGTARPSNTVITMVITALHDNPLHLLAPLLSIYFIIALSQNSYYRRDPPGQGVWLLRGGHQSCYSGHY